MNGGTLVNQRGLFTCTQYPLFLSVFYFICACQLYGNDVIGFVDVATSEIYWIYYSPSIYTHIYIGGVNKRWNIRPYIYLNFDVFY